MRVFGQPIEVKQAIDWAKLRSNQHLIYAVQTDMDDKEWYGWCLFMGKGETVHSKLSMRRKDHPKYHDGIQRFAFQDMVKWAQDVGLYPIDAGGAGVVAADEDAARAVSAQSMAAILEAEEDDAEQVASQDYHEERVPAFTPESNKEVSTRLSEHFRPKGKVVEPVNADKALEELLEAATRDAYWSGYRTGQLAERHQRGRA